MADVDHDLNVVRNRLGELSFPGSGSSYHPSAPLGVVATMNWCL